jgi:hypothetical protein
VGHTSSSVVPVPSSGLPHALPPHSASASNAAASNGVLFPSYRSNRNYWLEYSTPASTTLSDYDDYDSWRTTPEPRPSFVTAGAANHSVKEVHAGNTVTLDCRIKDLMDYQVGVAEPLPFTAFVFPSSRCWSFRILRAGRHTEGFHCDAVYTFVLLTNSCPLSDFAPASSVCARGGRRERRLKRAPAAATTKRRRAHPNF